MPACANCNHSASQDDEYFRLMLGLREGVGSQVAFQSVRDAAERSLQKPEKRRFKEAFLATVNEVDLISPAGLFTGTGTHYDVDVRRMNTVAERIVRGLTFHEHGRLPDGYTVYIQPDDAMTNLSMDAMLVMATKFLPSIFAGKHRKIGDAFEYWQRSGKHDVYRAGWILRFYGCVDFVALTSN